MAGARSLEPGASLRPLDDIVVLDLSRLLPGPYCTLLLADLGAEVWKVEDPEGGDYVRHMPPVLGDAGSALFHALNRSKKSVALDLRSEDGKAALRALAAKADVLVESFRPGVMEKLGLGAEALLASCPRLVYCSISGFGQTGPDRLRAGHDLGYMARAGALGFAGEAGAPAEAWPGVQVADVGGGSLVAAVGILAALRERDRTGKGRHLDVSMAEGALAFLHMHLAAAAAEGRGLGRGREALNGGYPCYGLYRTGDGRAAAPAAPAPDMLADLCAAAGRDDLSDKGYDRDARPLVEALFASRPLAAWVELGRAHDVCLEPVWEGEEVWSDPQHLARGMFVEVADPALPGGALRTLRSPVRLGEPAYAPAPALGAHTREVLEAAGVPAELVARLAR